MEQHPSNRPTIVLTHPHGEGDLMKRGLTEAGFEVTSDVMIKTSAIELTESDKQDIFAARRIILTSKRGVKYLFDQLSPADVLDKSFICIGKKTAYALERKGIKPWWTSYGKTAADLVEELKHARFGNNEKWVALLGNLADDTLESALQSQCLFTRTNIYRTEMVLQLKQETISYLEAKRELLVVCTSPSCFNGFMNNYGALIHDRVQFASIGPVTTKAMAERCIHPVFESSKSTYEGLLLTLKLKLTPIYR